MISQERLREVLDYNPETGEFRWKVATGPRAKIGAVAGRVVEDGYVRIKIDTHLYRAHRLTSITVAS